MLKIQHKNFNKDHFWHKQNVFYCVDYINESVLLYFSSDLINNYLFCKRVIITFFLRDRSNLLREDFFFFSAKLESYTHESRFLPIPQIVTDISNEVSDSR